MQDLSSRPAIPASHRVADPAWNTLETFLRFRRSPLDTLLELGQRGDAVSRLWLVVETVYFVNEPELIHQILVERRDDFVRGTNLETPLLLPTLGRGLLTTDAEEWWRLRRASQPAFTQEGVAAITPRIDKAAERLLGSWSTWTQPREREDVFFELVTLTSALALAALFDGEIDEADAHALARAMLDGQAEVLRRIKNPLRVPDWVPLPGNVEFRRGTNLMQQLIADTVARRGSAPARDGARDLHAVLQERARSDVDPLTAVQLRDQTITDFLAAPENTATTMTWVLYLLAKHPEIQTRVQAELDASATPLAIRDRSALLTQVLLETLRLYPGAPYFDRRTLRDVELDGCRIPASAIVMIAPYVLHRTPRFWAQPEIFRPERFAPGADAHKQPAYLPFGLGPRKCIGEALAFAIIAAVLPALLRRYRFELVGRAEVGVDPQINLRPRGGMPLQMRARARLDPS
jgi:cytochrome P450